MFRITHIAGITGLVFLAGCSLNLSDSLFPASELHAYAVGDNPAAVRAATEVFRQGGNAADAASAMYFALAVTDPEAAGLGGGGVCLVHNPNDDTNSEFVFMPGASGGNHAIPGAVKGIALMHYRYGSMAWQKVITPGEALADTGFTLSADLHAALAANIEKIRLDATLAREFLDESGNLKPVGAEILAPDLGSTLATLRTEGPQSFYTGTLAQRIAAYSTAQNWQITPEKLAAYRALKKNPATENVGDYTVYLPDGKSGAGSYVRTLIGHTASQEKQAAFVAALKKLRAGHQATHGATGFSVMDSNGMSVTCTVTMNAPFGAARTVPDTGIVLAGKATNGHAYLAPLIAAEDADAPADLTGAGAGGPASNAALVDVLMRINHDDAIYKRRQIRNYGNSYGDLVNLISCDDDYCAALPDPRGQGFGITLSLGKAK